MAHRQLQVFHKQHECIGCGLCAEKASHYFTMNEEGLAELHAPQKGKHMQWMEAFDEDRESLEQCVEGCPVSIISLRE